MKYIAKNSNAKKQNDENLVIESNDYQKAKYEANKQKKSSEQKFAEQFKKLEQKKKGPGATKVTVQDDAAPAENVDP